MAQITCIVVTPELTAMDRKVDHVVLPLDDGEIAIYPGHSPLIGRLTFGEMRIHVDGRDEHFYLDGGFAQVVGNVVSVLTDRAVPAAQVMVKAAQDQLTSAMRRPIHTPELLESRDRLVKQARAQLEVARRRH